MTFALFCTGFNTFAQEVDHGVWSSIELKKKFKKGVSVSLEEEYRLRENMQATDKFMTTLDLSWKPVSFLKGGISYTRIDYNHPANKKHNWENYWELRNRYSVYLTGRYEIGRFELSLREKFQRTYRDSIVSSEFKSNPTDLIRSKFEVTYDVKRLPLKPYFSCEIFYTLNEPTGDAANPSQKLVTEIRYATGLEYDLTKKLGIEAGYLYSTSRGFDDDAGGLVSELGHVLTVGMSYTF
jgi:opacity protein-like surface antigen